MCVRLQGLVKNLLEVADNLERAAASVPDEHVGDSSEIDRDRALSLLRSLRDGVLMTDTVLMKVGAGRRGGSEPDLSRASCQHVRSTSAGGWKHTACPGHLPPPLLHEDECLPTPPQQQLHTLSPANPPCTTPARCWPRRG